MSTSCSGELKKHRKYVQTIFFEIKGYFEISVFEITRISCISVIIQGVLRGNGTFSRKAMVLFEGKQRFSNFNFASLPKGRSGGGVVDNMLDYQSR